MDLVACKRCGREKELDEAFINEGLSKPEGIYCCQGCADDEDCTCEREAESMSIARIEEEEDR